jgi:hypothetical protein
MILNLTENNVNEEENPKKRLMTWVLWRIIIIHLQYIQIIVSCISVSAIIKLFTQALNSKSLKTIILVFS